MATLLDIAPSLETVSIRGTEVAVTGVSAAGFAYLLGRFPDLRKMMTGMEVEIDDLFGLAGDAIAPIIAAGTGMPANEEAEAMANSLSADEQSALIAAIFRQTFPQGVGPFVERLSQLAEGLGGGADPLPRAQATKSPKQSKA